MIIKICGLTRVEDGLAALEAGADWLGFVRWPNSPRFRALHDGADLVRAIRARATRPFQAVGVYVDAPRDLIRDELKAAGFDRVQLHGDEPMRLIDDLAVPAIKVIKIAGPHSIAQADAYPGVDLLTDTHDPALPGGTGRGYDISLLKDLVARRRVIVAGGLTPENVGDVVRFLHPYGVDVSSGVESSPGVKDHAKIARFIAAARGAAEGSERSLS